MRINYSKNNINKLFLNLLPAQIISSITTSLSGIVNGYVIGNYLSSMDMVALGFVSPLIQVIGMLSSIVSGGARILSGEYIGRGDKNKSRETFTASMYILLVLGVVITICGLLFSSGIAKLFGANGSSLLSASSYIKGLSIGFLPTMINPCLMIFLQMENDSNYALFSTFILALSNYVLALIGMKYLHVGMFGIGIITAMSHYITFIILFIRFVQKKDYPRIGRYVFSNIYKEIIILGFPCALAGCLYAFRNIQLNKFAFSIHGEDAVHALSILNSSCGPLDAFNAGVGSTLLMMASIYVGEKDNESIKRLIKTTIKYGVIIAMCKLCLISLFAKRLAIAYGASSQVAYLTNELYIHYGITMPFNIITITLTNINQSLKRISYVNILIIFNAMINPLGYILISKGALGINAVWSCFWVAEIITICIVLIVACIHNKGPVHDLDNLIYLEDSIKLEENFTISIRNIEEVSKVSREIELFCIENDIDKKRSMLAGLCCEEITSNIIEHGFSKCKKTKDKSIDIYVGVSDNEVNIRIKDNAVAFDPHIKIQNNNDDPTINIGIRVVSKIAKEMNYQNTFGLNVLTIKL